MRNEQQMLELILSTARQDERIRAVCLEGSRTNPKAPRMKEVCVNKLMQIRLRLRWIKIKTVQLLQLIKFTISINLILLQQ